MKDVIQKHHDEQDIQKIFIDRDIKNWREEIEIITEEMLFFNNLLQLKATETKANYSNLLKKIDEFKIANLSSKENLIGYVHKLEGIKECEDLQCETYFLNDHTDFKKKIENYFSKYRKLKKNIFSQLNKGMKM